MPEREAFHIGPFQIGDFRIDIPVHWYGIMIMLGVVAASYMAFREARRRGKDPDHVWNMFPWVLIAGILGARLGFIVSQLGDPHYQDITTWFKTWEGGLSIQGAVIGGIIAVVIYCRRAKLSFFEWADIIVPGLALAQAIGRWGNFFNQEAFGSKCDLPWCIPISTDNQRLVAGIANPDPNARFHPTFAYEMLWDLMNFGILMWLGRQRRIRLREGDLLWVYLIIYSIGRFGIELIRVDSAMVGGFKTPALVALLTVVIAWTMLIWRHRPTTTAAWADDRSHQHTSTSGAPRAARSRDTRVRRVHSFAAPDQTSSTPEAAGEPEASATTSAAPGATAPATQDRPASTSQ